MKISSIALLAIIPLFYGCTSTTIKSYSAEFTVTPVETGDAGKAILTPEGQSYTLTQVYKFECVLKETIQTDKGEATTRVVSSPFVSTRIGNEASVGVIGKGDSEGSMFEVDADESDSEYHIYLKSTFKEPGTKPISCSQTITIK